MYNVYDAIKVLEVICLSDAQPKHLEISGLSPLKISSIVIFIA